MKDVVHVCGHLLSPSWASFIPLWITRELPENVPETNKALAGAVPTAQPECWGWCRESEDFLEDHPGSRVAR